LFDPTFFWTNVGATLFEKSWFNFLWKVLVQHFVWKMSRHFLISSYEVR
jgi:hypothetical protein